MCVRVAVQFFFVKTPVPQALLHESPCLRPLRGPRKLVPTGVEPSALLHDCFLKGALLHDYTELSCNSGRRILGLFPSRRRKQKRLKRALGHCRARFPLSLAEHDRPRRLSRRQGRMWAVRCVWMQHPFKARHGAGPRKEIKSKRDSFSIRKDKTTVFFSQAPGTRRDTSFHRPFGSSRKSAPQQRRLRLAHRRAGDCARTGEASGP